jgi:PH (Pleckstrin Homology) domain-containing protein
MIFRPSTGGQIVLLTMLASGILLAIAALFLTLGYQFRDRGGAHYIFLGSGAFLLLLFFGSLNFRIRSYEIDSGNFVIKIGLTQKVYSLQNLEDARVVDQPFAGCRRIMGVGGLWSNCGLFSSPRWGEFYAYASNTDRGVLLTWPGTKVVVTPADPTSFIQSVKSKR